MTGFTLRSGGEIESLSGVKELAVTPKDHWKRSFLEI
jgi:hypothetical protein